MNGAVMYVSEMARKASDQASSCMRKASSWRMSKAVRSPSLPIDTLTITPRSSPSPLNSTTVLLQVADCDPQENESCAALKRFARRQKP